MKTLSGLQFRAIVATVQECLGLAPDSERGSSVVCEVIEDVLVWGNPVPYALAQNLIVCEECEGLTAPNIAFEYNEKLRDLAEGVIE